MIGLSSSSYIFSQSIREIAAFLRLNATLRTVEGLFQERVQDHTIMIKLRSLPLCVLASVLLCSVSALAQLAAPAVRIVNTIDESQLVTLTHTVHPLANARNDRGAAPDGMQLDRLQLVLQRSPAQEAALRQLITEIDTPGSPSYHQWLTPAQFGTQFGPSGQDISTIETWLGNHGFNVTKVNAGNGTLEFSGNVAQMREAFHTQIHKYVVHGETHYANANNPQIPAALAPVIGGFTSLNNFRIKSYAEKLGKAGYNPTTHQVSQWTWGNTTNGVYFVLAPADFAVQYDLNPLYAQGINGNGQTIAIVNDSNINIDLVNQFRTLFGLQPNPPQIVIDGNDPGVDGTNDPDGPNYDSSEAYLDVEWSGAVAPYANVDLVIAADTSLESGLILAAERAVYSNVAPVVSMSFGTCETDLGSENAFLSSLWEQAAAQGQTVTVSAGDSGSAGCDDDDSQYYAVSGQAVNGFASTPFNVAVGGTDFYYSDYATGGASIANYWNTTATQLPTASINPAKAPIQEQPWNDSQFGDNIYSIYTLSDDEQTSIAAGSGGASNAAICSSTYNVSTGACSGTLSGYPKPAWQSGTGVPNDTLRDLPDVALFSANGNNETFYPICATDGDCQTSGLGANGIVQIYGVGGTSASAPAFAGIMALVNQRYGPQGQADTVLYPLAEQYSASFHDITVGSNSVPCEISPTVTPNCITAPSGLNYTITDPTYGAAEEGQIGSGTTPEYNAGTGYDLASGLGSVDANQLVSNWGNVKLNSTTTTMTAVPANSAPLNAIPHGTSVTISGAVTSGIGMPSGDVALMASSTEPNQQGQTFFTLSNGSYTGSTSTLPGGTYDIWAQYGGDYTDGFSTSAKTQITVTPETPGMNFNLFNAAIPEYFTPTSAPGNSVDYGTQLMLSAEVAPTGQLTNLQSCVISGTNCSSLNYTMPTGTVTFKDSSSAINTAVVNAEGDAEYNAPFAVGAHSVTAVYNGDQSYNTYTSSAIPFTVIKDTPTFLYGFNTPASTSEIVTGEPTVFYAIVENGVQYSTYANSNPTAIAPVPVLPPTGTVTLTGFPSGVPTSANLTSGVDPTTGAQAGIATIELPSTLAAGTYTVNFTYSGDSNYLGNTGSPVSTSIQVVSATGLASTTAATMTGSISPNMTITITGTVTGVSGHPAPTGGVYFFSSGNEIGGIAIAPGTGDVSTFSAQLSSQVLYQGANFISIQYSGDANYAPSAFTLNSGNSIANPLSDFSLVPDSTIVAVNAGSNNTDTVNVTSVNGFTGAVSLTCAAVTPVTCTITPNPTLTSGESTTSTLTITAPSGAVNGNYNVVITGKDPTGEFIHTLAITAAVSGGNSSGTLGFTIANSGNITIAAGATTGNTSTISITPTNGFAGTVDLSCTVTPAPTNPATCSIPSSLEVTGVGAVSVNVTVATTATTTSGDYVVQVTGVAGAVTEHTDVDVAVSVPSFNLSNNQNISIIQGATTGNTSTISVTPTFGFTGTVALICAVTSAPTGATNPITCAATNLSPTSVDITSASAQNSTLTINSTGTTTIGAYTVTVTGTSGANVQTTPVSVQVNTAAMGFTLGNSGNINNLSPGATSGNTSTIDVASTSGGFNSSIVLTCAVTTTMSSPNDPPTCGLSPGSITPGQSSTLTITTTAASSSDLVYPKLNNGKGWLGAGGGAILALLVFFGIPARRRSWRSMLGLVVALVVLGGLSSCGGGGGGGGGGTSPGNTGTAAGAYTVTVTGVSGSITETTSVSLTVQ
jgi:trimeric autotransporter adhesin